jgi:VanZ family protein
MHKLLPWMVVILWMSVIFYLSHQSAAKSNELSTGITEVIIDTIETIAPQAKIEKGDLDYIVRKNAHFFTI